MSLQSINAALIDAYRNSGLLPDHQTAYENVRFTPPTDAPWAEVYVIPNQPAPSSLSDAGFDEHTGVLQINLNTPANDGTRTAYELADIAARHFVAGRVFAFNGVEVVIRACGRGVGRQIDGYFRVVLTVTWYAFTQRNNA